MLTGYQRSDRGGPIGQTKREREPELEILRVPQVANRLGICKRRVQQLLNKGLIPGYLEGRHWRIPRVALEEYMRMLVSKARRNLRPDI